MTRRDDAEREAWEAAGLYREAATALDRPLAIARLLIPGVLELAEDEIRWASGDRDNRQKERKPGPDVLERFTRLADAPVQEILAYARRWGVLALCEHGLPVTHDHGCRPRGWRDGAWYDGRDSVAVWRQFSRQARSILAIAARLHQRRVGSPADWQAVYSESGRQAPWWQQGMEVERLILARVLNQWLTIAAVAPCIQWDSAGPKVRLASGSGNATLFSVVATQLVFAVSRVDGVEMCSGCAAPFIPSRRPRPKQRRYCPPCRAAGVPLKHAQRDRRRRLQRAR